MSLSEYIVLFVFVAILGIKAGLSAWHSRRAAGRSSPATSDDLSSGRGEPAGW